MLLFIIESMLKIICQTKEKNVYKSNLQVFLEIKSNLVSHSNCRPNAIEWTLFRVGFVDGFTKLFE
jgi:hypothetical protein